MATLLERVERDFARGRKDKESAQTREGENRTGGGVEKTICQEIFFVKTDGVEKRGEGVF